MAEYSPGQLSKWGDFSESANVRGHGTPADTQHLQARRHGTPQSRTARRSVPTSKVIGRHSGFLPSKLIGLHPGFLLQTQPYLDTS